MKISTQNRMIQLSGFLGIIAVGVCLLPMTSQAATAKTATTATCTFTRDLQLGMTGEDVKCLQKYLNTHGFVIAASGVGSPGHETGEFKALTETAVIKWQKSKKLSPAIGYFGAQSRLLFKKGGTVTTTGGTTEPFLGAPLIQVPGTTVTTVTSSANDPEAALRAQVEALKAVLEGRATTLPTASTTNTTVAATVITPATTTSASTSTSDTTATDASVRALLKSVLNIVAKADTAIKKNSTASDISDAKDTNAAAKDEILIALRAYVINDYETAATTLGKANRDANSAYTAASAATQKLRANKSLTSLQVDYKDAVAQVTKASDDGKTVTSAKRYLKKAANAIDDVQTAIDDEKYADALDAVNTADGFIKDTLSAIGK